jgi:hypothetical protein
MGTGFLVEMVEDVAKEMGVEAVPVETTWATCVLRRITAQPFGIVHVLVTGQPTEYRLPQQPDKLMAAVPAGEKVPFCSARRAVAGGTSCSRWTARGPNQPHPPHPRGSCADVAAGGAGGFFSQLRRAIRVRLDSSHSSSLWFHQGGSHPKARA